ncbi:hypothetical protein [Borreliella carolinensis]|uniref:Uncharacterized protein n=1 Tax=Borreliella carolinensis TaxID=478174 RepID=A0ABZ3JCC6_9SPIR
MRIYTVKIMPMNLDYSKNYNPLKLHHSIKKIMLLLKINLW